MRGLRRLSAEITAEMSLKDRIGADLKEAMKAKDRLRADTLRSAISAFSYRRIEVGRELSDDDQLEAVRKLYKQRSDSIAEFERGGRADLVEKETRERDILATYLPPQKTVDEIRSLVRGAMAALPPEQRNQGALMKAVLPGLRGLADGGLVRTVVLEELAGQAGSS